MDGGYGWNPQTYSCAVKRGDQDFLNFVNIAFREAMTGVEFGTYSKSFETWFGVKPPEAYERLLLDCMLGDSTLYARRDMAERGWEIVQPILESWKKPAIDFPNYEAGSWGPQASFELIERDGRTWRKL